jgi:hypothetical protein
MKLTKAEREVWRRIRVSGVPHGWLQMTKLFPHLAGMPVGRRK